MTLTVNTNLAAMIVQNNLKKSGCGLNNAIQRMSAGYKINGAKDNAANYSISRKMETKTSAYEVALDNAGMGLDLITTASDSLSVMSGHMARIRDLAMQVENGTYGKTSLSAINLEVNARLDELERLYNTTEFNGLKLFGAAEEVEETVAGEFLIKVQKRDTSAMKTLASVSEGESLTSGVYSISTAEELAKLATMTNNGKIGQNTEFVLANDIDLSAYSTGEGWIPIGKTNYFTATFDGNGYVIKNLYINRPTQDIQGLFGMTKGTIKNLGLENVDVHGKNYVGGLVGENYEPYRITSYTISNCYSKGKVVGHQYVGGLVGYGINLSITECFSKTNVKGFDLVGGLLGYGPDKVTIKNSYTTGTVEATAGRAGGLVGWMQKSGKSSIDNCYSSCNVTGEERAGGLVGENGVSINNSYATGDISAPYKAGGLVGLNANGGNINNCYATGNVSGLNNDSGGLVGSNSGVINSCYASGSVQGKENVGGLVGINSSSVINSYSTGTPTGNTSVGDFIGKEETGSTLDSTSGAIAANTPKPYEYKPNKLGFLKNFGSAQDEDENNYISKEILFQVGINSSESSQITLSTSFALSNLDKLRSIGESNDNYLETIDKIIASISAKQTEYGSAQNRLESAIDEISIHYENLISSNSTIRDADIAQESSAYIRNQILQQAASTLLATANQTPSIALQLI